MENPTIKSNQIYEHIYFGVNLFTLGFVKQNLKPNRRYLIIFDNDYVDYIQPSMIMNNPIALTIETVKTGALNSNGLKNYINHIRKTYSYYSNKYSYLKRETYIKYETKSLMKRLYFAFMLNMFNLYYGLMMPLVRLDENYVYTKINSVDVNNIILRELTEMKAFGLDVLNYTEVNGITEGGDNLYSINVRDKDMGGSYSCMTKGYTRFINNISQSTTISEGNSNLEGEILFNDKSVEFGGSFMHNLIPYTQTLMITHTPGPRGNEEAQTSNRFLEESIYAI
jgi:hypothetical protein